MTEPEEGIAPRRGLTTSLTATTGSERMKESVLVTGGAGFIGSNLVHNLLNDGHRVTVFDALLRRGTEHNLAWLRSAPRDGRLRFVPGDVRDGEALRAVVREAEVIYHLAGQVAVTTSVEDPRTDYEINAV